MKEKILKFIYQRHKRLFYDFFVEEFISEVPKDISEPAMEWLGKGRDKLEKWILFQAHYLQRRIISDPKQIDFYQGMLAFMRILLSNVVKGSQKEPPRVMGKPEEEKKIDYAKEASAASTELSDFFSLPKKQREKVAIERKREEALSKGEG